VFVTTHLLRFAERLESERPIKRLATLQVEIGPREAPTYRFIPGVAKTSLAHKTAARLGVTREELVALIAEKRALFQSSSQESEPSEPPESVPSVRPPTVH
jgi:DNA mismatch repair protein MutS2